jgi:putative endonuclease
MPKTAPQIIGDTGEAVAQVYLEQKGLVFIARNWRCKLGEVDLIMNDLSEQTRVFVEVRTRRPTLYGEGRDTVAKNKQRKLINTARYYQQREQYWNDIRFDVVSIVLAPNGQQEIEHLENAFDVN